MKKFSLAFSLLMIFVFLGFSCKKINEATELGSDLIPPVDNVNTFEVALDAKTNNLIFNDTTTVSFYDEVAVGHISNDPEFGSTHANAYFTIGRILYGTHPFGDSVVTSIDSVVLSLAYTGGYGDTLAGSQLSIKVSEITDNSFSDTVFYKYSSTPNFNTGGDLATKTFQHTSLDDTLTLIRAGDTQKVANVVRITLPNSLGTRFAAYDTNNVYKNDAAFKKAFNGFAIKAENTGNSLAYFDLTDNTKTSLIIYYKAKFGGKDSALSTVFAHYPLVPSFFTVPANYRNGQANDIKRNYSGNAGSTLNNGLDNDEKLFIQSSPGTYTSIKIPALDTFENKIVHRAEIVAYRINDPSSSTYSVPLRLMLDRINKTGDTAFILEKDLITSESGSVGYSLFGGTLRSDQTYRFNITRYVQGILTRKEPNDTLRIYAPLRTTLYDASRGFKVTIPVANRIAEGRVILAGGNHPDTNMRLRLRIIYSNL
ncbi:MAG: DUF4270 family protein [Flavisolibacter sp.]